MYPRVILVEPEPEEQCDATSAPIPLLNSSNKLFMKHF
jgi:hypothetical protein